FGLESGKFYVRAAKSGAAESGIATYYPSAIDPANAAPITVDAGTDQRAGDLTLVAVKTAAVKFKLVGASLSNQSNQQMPAPLIVAIARGRNGQFIASVGGVPLGDNMYRISGLTPGSYEVFARLASRSGLQSGRLSIEIGDTDGKEIDVGPLPLSAGFALS